MIDWKILLQVILSLLFVIGFLYFLLPILLKRRIPYLGKKGNIEIEELIPVGKETFLASIKIKDRRYYILFSDKFAKILREENANTDSSNTL